MNFYIIYFIILQIPTVILRKELKIVNSGLIYPSDCKIGLEFYAELNNTSSEGLNVELIPDECCLSGGTEDCDSVQIVGECSEVIPRETTKAMKLIAPLLDPLERKGYCTIHVDSRPIDRRNSITRETLKIHFDTRIKKNNPQEEVAHCRNKDEDPHNNCRPVNCETYYNGQKSYFDKVSKRCVEVPPCINRKVNTSNVIYDPLHNRCVNNEYISNDDIAYIKSLSKKDRHPKDILIIKSVNKEQTSVPNTVENLLKYNIGNDKKAKILPVPKTFMCYSIHQYLSKNKYTLIVLGLVIIVQCCLIVTMVYCLTNNSPCCNKKKVERKFFNYRQDASVTTPLIGTSNIETETTQFDFISESSNQIDQKIKCYKACQKERPNNAKMCMSDDILSKCLNRRDWTPKPKSDVITETHFVTKKQDEEIQVSKTDNESEVVCEREEKHFSDEKNDLRKDSAFSEKELQCHNYNFQQPTYKDNEIAHFKNTSISTEKSAQAYFSNDSIDDILSQRGMIFIGENASKYSFTSNSSPGKSSLTELTSKTSKNNIIKHVMSFLSKSKVGTSSEPGVNKSKSKNLELLHFSHVNSSSSASNKMKGVKMVKESRSSF